MKPSLLGLLLALFAAAPSPAFASESYARPEFEQPLLGLPENETPAMRMERELYALGQRIYRGKMQLKGGGEASSQEPRLMAAQAQLPAREAKKKNLVSFAGKLSQVEFVALLHYVNQRFPLPKKKK